MQQQIPLTGASAPRKRLPRGLYITFEGGEGSGKSTQLRLLGRRLADEGYAVIETKQPGGTEVGVAIRALLLHKSYAGKILPKTESLLYWADRHQHHEAVVKPALAEGAIVLGDRDFDSSWAYQHYARGLDAAWMRAAQRNAAGDFEPTRTILFDGPVETLLKRSLAKNAQVVHERGDAADESRLELEKRDFHERVRAGYLEMARENPQRIVIVDALGTEAEVHARAWDAVKDLFETR